MKRFRQLFVAPTLWVAVLTLLLMVLPISSSADSSPVLPTYGDRNALAQANSPYPSHDLLQFTAGRHVLGFLPDKVYLVGMPHLLSVEFEGTAGVVPVTESHLPPSTLVSIEEARGRGSQPAPPLSRVTYPNLWNGISLTYEAAAGGIAKSTYRLEPHADVNQIRLRYNLPLALLAEGSLQFRPQWADEEERSYFSESAPIAWQEIDGQRLPVKVSFRLIENRKSEIGNPKFHVGFRLGHYNPAYPLLIDPTYQWHTFMGAAADGDYGYDIVVDGSGNVYVTGWSTATWDGPGSIAPLNAHAGSEDIMVLKLNSWGAYQWHTFMGSAADGDFGWDLAVDGSGNVYVTGYSSATWDGPGATAPLNAFAGSLDIVVLKLNSSGTYQWHTFMGSAGGGMDEGYDIVVDGSGNVYVTGYSSSPWDGPGATAPLNAFAGSLDIVVLKLNSSGTYQWHTFMGSADFGSGLAVDGSGNIYVTGNSSATWDGPGATAPLNAFAGGADIVVLKLNSSGTYQWHTFMGSAGGSDAGFEIAVDGSGNVYVTGWSAATWDGPGATAPLNAYAGDADMVVLKLNSSGAYQWHTFMGSAGGSDFGDDIAVDGSGNVYVAGDSSATWDGPGATAPLNAFAGFKDIVVLKLNSSGAYQWHTFMGGASWDEGWGLAVDGSGNVYVTGYSSATWDGPGATAPLNPYAGSDDIVVLRFGSNTIYLPLIMKNQ